LLILVQGSFNFEYVSSSWFASYTIGPCLHVLFVTLLTDLLKLFSLIC
jgi:hypothetical protein